MAIGVIAWPIRYIIFAVGAPAWLVVASLALHGFKSFADRTEIAVHEGITAIVGPNGCGKSNISDALRWVLGEQRPTAIRGSRMEEAIFQGTSQRKPIHRAEVSLTLANEDGILALPQAEVVIGRTPSGKWK